MTPLNFSQEVLDIHRSWEREAKKALVTLRALEKQKITLERPVMLVPGWTDEANGTWRESYFRQRLSLQAWFEKICRNPENLHFIESSQEESRISESFFDLGEILKEKIRGIVNRRQSVDCVAHSMGGLTAMAALNQKKSTGFRVKNLVTVATPHLGTQWGDILASFVGRLLTDYEHYHELQGKSMDPDQPWIQEINRPLWRRHLLQRVCRLFCLFGSRDMAVMNWAKFDIAGLGPVLQEKVHYLEYGGAAHSGKNGITTDPRVILDILMILSGRY